MKVICINDTGKPKQIPQEKWVIKGEKYTINQLVRLSLQPDKLAVSLKELPLDESCFPYEYFDADRFAPYFEETISEVKANPFEEFQV